MDYSWRANTRFELVQSTYRDTVRFGSDSTQRGEVVDALNEAYSEAPHFDDDPDAWDTYWDEFRAKPGEG